MSSVRRAFALSLALMLSLSLAACDGGTTPPDDPLEPTDPGIVEDTRLVNALSEQDFQAFCKGDRLDILSAEERAAKLEVWCIDRLTDFHSCESAEVARCVTDLAPDRFADECTWDWQFVDHCGDITVGEVLTCDLALAAQAIARRQNLSCDVYDGRPAEPAACQVVRAACGGLLYENLE
jgi:hypothetical protein